MCNDCHREPGILNKFDRFAPPLCITAPQTPVLDSPLVSLLVKCKEEDYVMSWWTSFFFFSTAKLRRSSARSHAAPQRCQLLWIVLLSGWIRRYLRYFLFHSVTHTLSGVDVWRFKFGDPERFRCWTLVHKCSSPPANRIGVMRVRHPTGWLEPWVQAWWQSCGWPKKVVCNLGPTENTLRFRAFETTRNFKLSAPEKFQVP